MLTAKRTIIITVCTFAIAVGHMSANAAPLNPRDIESKTTTKAMHTVTVRVLIYSGRPDPEFVMPVSQIQALMKKAKRAKAKRENVIPARLGYKGMLVENPTKAGGLPEFLAIHNGKIEAGDKAGKKKTYFVDEGRSMENALLKEAVKRKAIGEDLYKKIRTEEKREPKTGDGETSKD
jgi:hypothetical protein